MDLDFLKLNINFDFPNQYKWFKSLSDDDDFKVNFNERPWEKISDLDARKFERNKWKSKKDELYKDFKDNYQPSSWWKFYINLGAHLFNEKNFLKVALIVPSRMYVSSLISLGSALASSKLSANEESRKEHYEYLKSLHNNCALYRKENIGSKRDKASLIKRDDGEIRAVINNNKKLYTEHYITEKNCLKYSKADVEYWDKCEITERNTKKNEINFLETFFNFFKEDFTNYLLSKYKVTTVIGNKRILNDELKKDIFLINNYEGSISDFMNLNSDCKKLDLYSQTDQDFISAHSPLVIYDSSLSYLYHRAISGLKGEYLKPFHEILILDKTDSYYNESINEWNKEFTNVDYKLDNIVCPDGVEIAFSKGIFND